MVPVELYEEKEYKMGKFSLLLAAVCLTGCARVQLIELTSEHPAHPNAPQPPERGRVSTLDTDLGHQVRVSPNRAESDTIDVHVHHGH